MSDSYRPETPEQVRELVAWALSEEAPLEVLGQGSKRGLGRPVQAERALDLTGLTGILLYEPDELVLQARAGTPLAEIEAALAEKNQQLAFEPMDYGPLYGAERGSGTLGGLVACNLSGPRRIKMGAARDHILGVSAVSGRGEVFKSGGRVVKNVTGYDLSKLLAGSYGTLGVMTEVTIKVLPAPERTRSVLIMGLDEKGGLRAMTRALTSAHEVSGAAHLPAELAARSAVSYVREAATSVTAIRVEGPTASAAHRCQALRQELADLGPSEELHSQNSATLWRELRDVEPLAGLEGQAIWRISVAPSAGPGLVEAIRKAGVAAWVYYDWGGGLIWLATPASEDAGADTIRGKLHEAGGGHATLVRAPETLRASVPVFEPQDPAKVALQARIKEGFDPKRLLNPGRMLAGQ